MARRSLQGEIAQYTAFAAAAAVWGKAGHVKNPWALQAATKPKPDPVANDMALRMVIDGLKSGTWKLG